MRSGMNNPTLMKNIMVIITAALMAGGASGLIPWTGSPVDEGQMYREKADKIMGQLYGVDWMNLYESSVQNHSPNEAMKADYKMAIGYHPSK